VIHHACQAPLVPQHGPPHLTEKERTLGNSTNRIHNDL
jgi:hypothetical protein